MFPRTFIYVEQFILQLYRKCVVVESGANLGAVKSGKVFVKTYEPVGEDE